MIQIRSAQIEVFRKLEYLKIAERLSEYFQENYSEQVEAMGSEKLSDLIDLGLEKGRNFGIDTEYDARRFIECLIIYGAGFGFDGNSPWAREILDDRKMGGTEKMDRINEYETFSLDP